MQNLRPIDRNIWELPKTGKMRVPARLFANAAILKTIKNDNSLQQIKNVASLPGIQKYAIAMPDVHLGYGFPIGGVAAMEPENGVISPAGVGYDINCGVRFIRTNLSARDDRIDYDTFIDSIFQAIPSGVGSRNSIKKLNLKEMKKVLSLGAKWAIDQGFGHYDDIESIEENGFLSSADPIAVSKKALSRGAAQLGTLGSGNHFVELGRVSDLFDPKTAKDFDLLKDQLIVMIHTGSRGLGHQVCKDYVKKMKVKKQDFSIPDKQLASVKIKSNLGKEYYQAMSCAANYAWANRQIIMSKVENRLRKELNISSSSLGFRLLYDVCHNIAKFEEHLINGNKKLLCVHRKGATRAFSADRQELSAKFGQTGQPVIIPGDMGTESFLCVGREKAEKTTFGSSSHGAGRVMSRRKALRSANFGNVSQKLSYNGIKVRAAKKNTVVEEMSAAYKNVEEVVNTMSEIGIIKKVARTKPLAVIKG